VGHRQLVLNVPGLPAVIGEMPYISFVCVSRPGPKFLTA
jgi:hypothetical protein